MTNVKGSPVSVDVAGVADAVEQTIVPVAHVHSERLVGKGIGVVNLHSQIAGSSA